MLDFGGHIYRFKVLTLKRYYEIAYFRAAKSSFQLAKVAESIV
jgi:hypothetical protein